MKECSKSINRRLSDSNFLRKYFIGDGVDIGGKPDPLSFYKEFFPLIKSIRTWDWEDGDAQYMESVPSEHFYFVHSSHCLEPLKNTVEGLKNWLRILRPGGHLIITVPDDDMYEQGVFPSAFNADNKWTFTIFKSKSWSANSINIIDLLRGFESPTEILKVEKLTSNYFYELPRFDQTLTPVSECGIEIIVRKAFAEDALMYPQQGLVKKESIDREILIHLNQYVDDMRAMKERNKINPPFKNENLDYFIDK